MKFAEEVGRGGRQGTWCRLHGTCSGGGDHCLEKAVGLPVINGYAQEPAMQSMDLGMCHDACEPNNFNFANIVRQLPSSDS